LAKSKLEQLRERHPEAKKNAEYRELSGEIDRTLAAQELKAKKERDEAERLANLNNTGMWRVRYYVDNFNEPTKTPYITNPQLIVGIFSNTATQDSPLQVKFLIDSAESIDIQLYEYAGNNPVKAGVYDDYVVLVRDKDDERMELRATNYGDRLSHRQFCERCGTPVTEALSKIGPAFLGKMSPGRLRDCAHNSTDLAVA